MLQSMPEGQTSVSSLPSQKYIMKNFAQIQLWQGYE